MCLQIKNLHTLLFFISFNKSHNSLIFSFIFFFIIYTHIRAHTRAHNVLKTDFLKKKIKLKIKELCAVWLYFYFFSKKKARRVITTKRVLLSFDLCKSPVQLQQQFTSIVLPRCLCPHPFTIIIRE